MRHGKKFNHLSRQTGHRKAMLANMACSLIEHKRINTTVAKAKALKQFVEPLITKSKEDTTHNRRIVFAYLRSKYAVTDLFRDVAAKVGDRPGGYTRIIKVGNRLGDNADMAMIELVDFNELYNGGKKEAKKSRSRRGGKAKGADTTAPAAPKAAPVAEAPVEEAPEAVVEAPVVETVAPEVETPQVEEAVPVAEAEEAPAAETETPTAEAEETPADDTEKKEDAE
ncbi:MAG: 50S ribosomal protein L17 [Flavobacterium sp. BFFFF1]|nr:MAG: 50S ribosomal protein L17 [Flavobacterium sp. BFFFF1]